MNLDKFTGPGSTPSRRVFWDKVADAVLASQKLEGRNASVDEHEGQGTVINFPDQTPESDCFCNDQITIEFSGITLDCGCIAGSSAGFSYTFEEFDPVNASFVVPNDSDPGCAFYGIGNCGYIVDPNIDYTVKQWNGVSDCSGSPSFIDQVAVFYLMALLYAGTWEVFYGTFTNGPVFTTNKFAFFYGTTTDISMPISNTIGCTADAGVNITSPLFDLILGLTPFIGTGVAENGTAMITIP